LTPLDAELALGSAEGYGDSFRGIAAILAYIATLIAFMTIAGALKLSVATRKSAWKAIHGGLFLFIFGAGLWAGLPIGGLIFTSLGIGFMLCMSMFMGLAVIEGDAERTSPATGGTLDGPVDAAPEPDTAHAAEAVPAEADPPPADRPYAKLDGPLRW